MIFAESSECQDMTSTLNQAAENFTYPSLPACIESSGQPEVRACEVFLVPIQSLFHVNSLLNSQEYDLVYRSPQVHLIFQLFLWVNLVLPHLLPVNSKINTLNNCLSPHNNLRRKAFCSGRASIQDKQRQPCH